MNTLGADEAALRPHEAGSPGRHAGGSSTWLITAIGTLLIAGVLHFLAAVDHRDSATVVLGFFLLVALGQLSIATWLTVGAATGSRPRTWQTAAILAATVVLVGLYLVAHTSDLLTNLTSTSGADAGPAGHDHAAAVSGPIALGQEPVGTVEPPSVLGSATVALELVGMMALLALLPAGARRRAVDVILVLGGLAWVLWWTGVPV